MPLASINQDQSKLLPTNFRYQGILHQLSLLKHKNIVKWNHELLDSLLLIIHNLINEADFQLI